MAFVICEPCVDVKDTACVEVCPVDCIYEYEGLNQLYIHPTECIDCAACEPECPVEAIFPLEDVPGKWQSYIAINADILDTHPASTAVGRSDGDAPAPDAAQPMAASAPASTLDSADIAALRQLLRDLGDKKTTSDDALEEILPLLEKLGVTVTSA